MLERTSPSGLSREAKAGSTAGEAKAGSTAGEAKAGSTAGEAKAGSAAGEAKAGSAAGAKAGATAEVIAGLPAGERFRLRVAGTSMAPVLLDGDEVVAVRAAAGAWRCGDVLVVDLPDAGLVIHRLLWTSASAVRTRGDGSGRMDAPVPLERVLGTVVEVRRDGRDVTEGGAARRLAWARHFAAAAWHRLGRRLALAGRGRDGGSR